MLDFKTFLQPEAIARIARLELRARHIVEGLLAGMHRSPHFGQSIEFRQHRQYAPGDDLRHVDWLVWARQDRLCVKQYDEDTNLACYVLVDASASMAYGNGPLNKYAYAATLAASLAYLALKQHDAVGCTAFDCEVRGEVPPRARRQQLAAIVHTLERQTQFHKSGIAAVLKHAAETMPRRGMIVVVSDLFGDVDQTISGLRRLRQRGHDVVVLHVMDDDELDFPFSGATRFEDLESSDALACNPRALRDGYLQAVDEFLAGLRHGCAQSAIDYALVRTSQSFEAALVRFLNHRMKVHQRAG